MTLAVRPRRVREPRRRALLGACLWLLAAACSSPAERAPEPAQVHVRALTYNVHHGRGADGEIDLERIAAVIRAAAPDLVALQEVDFATQRSGGIDQGAELARLTGLVLVRGDNIDFQGGRYGNAVLSRWPVVEHHNHPLPSMTEGEQRGVLEVRVRAPGGELGFLATHLDYRPDDAERRASVAALRELLARLDPTPAILAGDLNCTPDSAVMEGFRADWSVAGEGAELPTFPALEPVRRIDYVLFRPPAAWRELECGVPDEPHASDHRPQLALLERR